MAFNPQSFFKSSKICEYDSYCQGIEDVMELLAEEQEVSYKLRNKVMSLVVEACDEFT